MNRHDIYPPARTHDCPICKNPKKYFALYDCYFCSVCNIWLESKCGDTECDYCQDRPQKPNVI